MDTDTLCGSLQNDRFFRAFNSVLSFLTLLGIFKPATAGSKSPEYQIELHVPFMAILIANFIAIFLTRAKT